MFGIFADRRRARFRAQPFPAAWAEILDTRVPLVRRLPAEDRAELLGLVQLFLHEKNLEGAGGLVLSDEIRVTIAALACLLLLRRGVTEPYPELKSIVVYPRGWHATTRHALGDHVVESRGVHLGESWRRGLVVISWDDARHGAADEDDGHNVVLHEFAHQLDSEDGPADGAPTLPDRSMYGPWAAVLGAEYAALIDALHRDEPTAIDPYGATNPAEFFAVITEAFFERPRAMRARYPALYGQLSAFYRQDPADW